MKKYCTKCGKPFEAVGREVICPACREAAAEATKKAAVLKAKRASWAGESVPVRISGRASTVIRRYGAANGLPFAAALDDLLKSSAFFRATGKAWEDITPYKSHRRDKHAQDEQDAPQGKQDKQDGTQATSKPQEAPQEAPQDVPQDEPAKPVKQAAKQASKATSSKASASKTAAKAARK